MEKIIEQTNSGTWLEEKYRIRVFIEDDYGIDTSFINYLYKLGYSFLKDQKEESLDIYNLLAMIPRPVMIVVEPYYIDLLYRDSYYHYYSEVLSEISRNCSRVSFFYLNEELRNIIGNFNYSHPEEILLDNGIQAQLEKDFIGTVTLRPLYNRIIGRVLLDPSKVIINGEAYLRKTHTMVTIFGHGYKLDFFPLASQDGLYMTCAETSLWMIFEYFGLQYSDYHTVLPSEFIDYNAQNNPERTLPTPGMDVKKKSGILKNFGLYPKIYDLDTYIKKFKNGAEDFYTLFHIYVESGIPLVLSLLDDHGNNGHSVICIGHGTIHYDILDSEEKNYVSWMDEQYGIEIIDSSQLIDRYIIMDDNSIPYRTRTLDQLSFFDNKLKLFIAPLNRKVYMDAQHAAELFGILIKRYRKDIAEYLNTSGLESRKVIRRIFLTTARKYKTFRTKNGKGFLEKEFYANLPCAKFIWVMELGISSKYKENKVFAEFILDATGGKEVDNTAIIIRIGSKVGYHGFDEGYSKYKEIISESVFEKIVDYYEKNRNIMKGDNTFLLKIITSDNSLLSKHLNEFSSELKDDIFGFLHDIVMGFIIAEDSGGIEDASAEKRNIKQNIENYIFSKIDRVYGGQIFINSAINLINERFVKCANMNIFEREFELYENNLEKC